MIQLISEREVWIILASKQKTVVVHILYNTDLWAVLHEECLEFLWEQDP